jgi:hypothetical protein
MIEPMEKIRQRMAALFQPGVAEGVEGLVFGCNGGLAGAAVNLVDRRRGIAARRRRGGEAGFHDQLQSITLGADRMPSARYPLMQIGERSGVSGFRSLSPK